MTENVSKMCFIVNFKISKRHPHFLCALLDSSYPKNMGIDITIMTLAKLES